MKTIDGLPLREAILHAAMETFMERGYEQTSMDEVALRAGTTKRTVYAHHGNKERLFHAALATAAELFFGQLPEPDPAGDPHVELEAFAARFCELCTTWGSVSLQRIAMGLAERFPGLGRQLHQDVIERAETMLATYLETLGADRSWYATAEGEAAADARLLLNMATGSQRFATLLGAQPALDGPPGATTSPAVDREPIRQAVQLFLAGRRFAPKAASG